jgi:hypothetical protein
MSIKNLQFGFQTSNLPPESIAFINVPTFREKMYIAILQRLETPDDFFLWTLKSWII